MFDRQKVETVLVRRFPGAPFDRIASAANAIMGMDDEWEEVLDADGYSCFSGTRCAQACSLAEKLKESTEYRLLRRRQDCRLRAEE